MTKIFWAAITTCLVAAACTKTTPSAENTDAAVLRQPVPELASVQTTRYGVYNGLLRKYITYVPGSLPLLAKSPLILALHGGGSNADNMINLTRFNSLADTAQCFVVYPNAYIENWNDGRDSIPERLLGVDDVSFISKLIDSLVIRFPRIDRNRVYVCGISNGGLMSMRLACQLSGKIAAAGAVAASITESISNTCTPANKVGVTLLPGSEDPLIPIGGGAVRFGRVVSHSTAVNKWIAINQCSANPQTRLIPNTAADGTFATERLYSPAAAAGQKVSSVIITNGGHTWPGGPQYLPIFIIGRTCYDFDASVYLWNYFRLFSR